VRADGAARGAAGRWMAEHYTRAAKDLPVFRERAYRLVEPAFARPLKLGGI